jgi:Uma2 family endonuclease
MAAAGILDEDDRVELIEGEIVDMAPIGGQHIGCVNRLTGLFARGLADVVVQAQSPIRLDEHTEPQPDLVLLRPGTTNYPAWPKDVLLVVEVADTSLRYDRQVKLPLYARAGIPEVWLVDVSRRAIIVHRDPSPDGYRAILTVRGDERVAPGAFPGFPLTANQILG